HRGCEHLLGDLIDGSTEYGDVGPSNRRAGVQESLVNGTNSDGPIEAGALAAGTKYVLGHAALARRESDGAANQAYADNGQGVDGHRWGCPVSHPEGDGGIIWPRECFLHLGTRCSSRWHTTCIPNSMALSADQQSTHPGDRVMSTGQPDDV